MNHLKFHTCGQTQTVKHILTILVLVHKTVVCDHLKNWNLKSANLVRFGHSGLARLIFFEIRQASTDGQTIIDCWCLLYRHDWSFLLLFYSLFSFGKLIWLASACGRIMDMIELICMLQTVNMSYLFTIIEVYGV